MDGDQAQKLNKPLSHRIACNLEPVALLSQGSVTGGVQLYRLEFSLRRLLGTFLELLDELVEIVDKWLIGRVGDELQKGWLALRRRRRTFDSAGHGELRPDLSMHVEEAVVSRMLAPVPLARTILGLERELADPILDVKASADKLRVLHGPSDQVRVGSRNKRGKGSSGPFEGGENKFSPLGVCTKGSRMIGSDVQCARIIDVVEEVQACTVGRRHGAIRDEG